MTPDLMLAVLMSSCGVGRFWFERKFDVALAIDESPRLFDVVWGTLAVVEDCGA